MQFHSITTRVTCKGFNRYKSIGLAFRNRQDINTYHVSAISEKVFNLTFAEYQRSGTGLWRGTHAVSLRQSTASGGLAGSNELKIWIVDPYLPRSQVAIFLNVRVSLLLWYACFVPLPLTKLAESRRFRQNLKIRRRHSPRFLSSQGCQPRVTIRHRKSLTAIVFIIPSVAL